MHEPERESVAVSFGVAFPEEQPSGRSEWQRFRDHVQVLARLFISECRAVAVSRTQFKLLPGSPLWSDVGDVMLAGNSQSRTPLEALFEKAFNALERTLILLRKGLKLKGLIGLILMDLQG